MKKYEVDKSICAGCGACINACPYGAIKIGKDGKAVIDMNKCQQCGACVKICPFNSIKEVDDEIN
ncbi:4Fe-4S binding protein [Candidatus Wolfebacteria bacterium]|nr:4Fe-4S binding protein [Candidatus Wolfebacteria bacterium]